MMRAVKRAIALLVLLVPVAARAQAICPPPMPGQTHEGFFARLQLGGTYLTAQQGDRHYAGPGVALGLAAGGMLRRDLGLFAMLSFHVALAPHVEVGAGATPISGVDNVESDAFGGGLAYYLEPLNVHAAVAVTGGTVQVFDKDDNRLAGSKTGLGFAVLAGKEWWVGRDWGMGLAGELTGAWATDSDDSSVHWHAFTYSLLMSATTD